MLLDALTVSTPTVTPDVTPKASMPVTLSDTDTPRECCLRNHSLLTTESQQDDGSNRPRTVVALCYPKGCSRFQADVSTHMFDWLKVYRDERWPPHLECVECIKYASI